MNLKLGLGLTLLALSLQGFAQNDRGGHDGGGGQGVVCYGQDGAIESVELLDFYEGRILEGLNIQPQIASTDEDLARYVANKYSWYFKEMTPIDDVIKAFRFLPSGTRLNTVFDSNTIFIPSNCKLEQIANFQGISRIFIVKDFWDKMSPVDRAGLYAHELIWFTERNAGAMYSSRARRTVARLFSDNFKGIEPSLLPRESGPLCLTVTPKNKITNYFWLEQNTCTLHFNRINGEQNITRHQAKLNNYECKIISHAIQNPWEIYQDGNTHASAFRGLIDVTSLDQKTHQILFSWNHAETKWPVTMTVDNHEFPGYDSEEENLRCIYGFGYDPTPTKETTQK